MVKLDSKLPQLDKLITLLREKKNVEKDVIKFIDSTILVAEKQLKTLKKLRKDKM